MGNHDKKSKPRAPMHFSSFQLVALGDSRRYEGIDPVAGKYYAYTLSQEGRLLLQCEAPCDGYRSHVVENGRSLLSFESTRDSFRIYCIQSGMSVLSCEFIPVAGFNVYGSGEEVSFITLHTEGFERLPMGEDLLPRLRYEELFPPLLLEKVKLRRAGEPLGKVVPFARAANA